MVLHSVNCGDIWQLGQGGHDIFSRLASYLAIHQSSLKSAVAISRNSNTSRALCILSQKYFPIASVDREKSKNHNNIYFMAFALKGTVLKIVKEKVIGTWGRSRYVMQ